MKKLLLTLFGALLALPAMAESVVAFSYTYEGQTLWYDILDESEKTVSVFGSDSLEGSVYIPSKASYTEEGITHIYSVTSIDDWAFERFTGMTSVTIPNSVTEIGERAFISCTGLTSITIPSSVTSIGEGAFYFCTGLTEIIVDEENPNYSSENGILFSKDKRTLIQYPIGNSQSQFEIPNSVTEIGYQAFSNCLSLTSITIPNCVTKIGDNAFFSTSLTSVTIPNSVTEIGSCAYAWCTGLTEIIVEEENPNYSCENGVLYSKNKNTLIQYPIGNNRLRFKIPNSVTEIGDEAFSYCTSLTSVTIPNSITAIANYSFSGCSGLTSVTYLAENPIMIEYDYSAIFSMPTYEKATLNYLNSAEDKIAVTEPWSKFKNRIGRDADFVDDSSILEVKNFDGKRVAVYDMRGVRVGTSTDGLPKGLYIVREGSTTRKIAI